MVTLFVRLCVKELDADLVGKLNRLRPRKEER